MDFKTAIINLTPRSDSRAEQIAFHLMKADFDVAFVDDGESVYHSYFAKNSVDSTSSAVITLLQGIFTHFQDHSFFILRKRIYTTSPLSEKDIGMIKVVAKRATSNIRPKDWKIDLTKFKFHEIHFDRELVSTKGHLSSIHHMSAAEILEKVQTDVVSDKGKWNFIDQLAKENLRGEVLHDFDRPIAAALWDAQNNLLSFGVNSNKINKTLHAEINLLQSFFSSEQRAIPKGSRLFSTHKPCRMCAGMIFDNCEDPGSLKVLYRHEETGSLSRNTILDRMGLNRAWVSS